MYCEYYDRIADAYYREKQVQGWSRKKKQALIEQNPEKLVEYSRNYTQYPPAEPVEPAEPAEPVEAGAVAAAIDPLASTPLASTPLASTSSASEAGPAADPPPEPVEGDGDNLRELGYGG